MGMMLRKALVLQIRFPFTVTPSSLSPQSLHHLLYPFSSSSTSISTSEKSKSFTVSYLINSCGLSHKDALSAVLRRSLENQIIPSFNFLKDFLQLDEKTIAGVKGFSRIILFDLRTCMASNIKALQEFGVPKSNIGGCLLNFTSMFMVSPELFRKNLEEVKKMGLNLNPSLMNFVVAVKAIGGWERKIDLYKRWG